MLNISSINYEIEIGSGKGAKTLLITNHGLSETVWKLQKINPSNLTGTVLLSLELDVSKGIAVTPVKVGKALNQVELQRAIADRVDCNLPSVLNPSPENQGSILLAVAYRVARDLKGAKNGARINAGCVPVDATGGDWINAYLELEAAHNFPIYCREEFVGVMKEHNLFLEFPSIPVKEVAPSAKAEKAAIKA